MGREMYSQTNRKTDGEFKRLADRWTGIRMDRWANRKRKRDRQMNEHKDK